MKRSVREKLVNRILGDVIEQEKVSKKSCDSETGVENKIESVKMGKPFWETTSTDKVSMEVGGDEKNGITCRSDKEKKEEIVEILNDLTDGKLINGVSVSSRVKNFYMDGKHLNETLVEITGFPKKDWNEQLIFDAIKKDNEEWDVTVTENIFEDYDITLKKKTVSSIDGKA